MTISIRCDSCGVEADAAAKKCPGIISVWLGGDPIDGDGAEPVVEWHACAKCREAFLKSLPVKAAQKGRPA